MYRSEIVLCISGMQRQRIEPDDNEFGSGRSGAHGEDDLSGGISIFEETWNTWGDAECLSCRKGLIILWRLQGCRDILIIPPESMGFI